MRRDWLTWLLRALDIAIVTTVAVSAAYLLQSASVDLVVARAAFTHERGSLLAVLAGLSTYVVAHLLRAIRLYVIIGIGRVRFTALLGYHSIIALATFATPFKAGELLRAAEAFRLLGNSLRGAFAVWIDRLFDVAALILMLGPLAFAGQRQSSVLIVLSAASLFLIVSVVIVLVVPGALTSFARAMLASTSRRSMLLLTTCMSLRRLLSEIPQLDRQTLALLAIITGLIWILELGALFLVLNALAEPPGHLVGKAADVFASVLNFQAAEPPTAHVALYRLVSLAGLFLLTLVTARRYLRARFMVPRSLPGTRQYRHVPVFTAPRLAMKGRSR
jgi:hypothetical protein